MTKAIRNAISELGRAYQFLGLASGEVTRGVVQSPQYTPQAQQVATLCTTAQTSCINLVTTLQALSS